MTTLHTISRSAICMDTIIAVKTVSSRSTEETNASIDKAFAIFRNVEAICSRFDENSELRRLSLKPFVSQPVSPLLFEALRFAIELAYATDGIFDPSVGRLLERKGFSRHYLTGCIPDPLQSQQVQASYNDIQLDEQERTVTLLKPILLDLGAVAKGLAVDLAKRELEQHEGFFINAGGDIFAGGCNERNEPWHIGIRHPLQPDSNICVLRISDSAVCTSGGYERKNPLDGVTHHLLDPRTEKSSSELLSCTVIAPYAMLADGLSTAAFLLGRQRGLALVESLDQDGFIITSALEISMTEQIKRYLL